MCWVMHWQRVVLLDFSLREMTTLSEHSGRRTVKIADLVVGFRLCEGALGGVYHLRDKVTGTEFAVAIRQTTQQGFLTEMTELIKTRKSLNLKRLVRIYSTYIRDGFGIIMELADYGSLRAILRRVPPHKECVTDPRMPLCVYKALAVGLLEAVCELEACEGTPGRGDHHISGAIRPSKILLLLSGDVKVLDYGNHTALDALHDSMPALHVYIPPERVRGEPFSNVSHIWSLGVTLMECIWRMPFVGEKVHDNVETYWKAVHTLLPGAPDTPEVRFARKFLVVEPAMRPTARELLSDPFLDLGTKSGRQIIRRWLREIVQPVTFTSEVELRVSPCVPFMSTAYTVPLPTSPSASHC